MGARRTHDLDHAQLRSLSEALLEAAEAAELGLVVTVDDSEHGDIRGVYVSTSAASMLGYEPEELLDRPLMSQVVPEERKRLEERHRQRLAGAETPRVLETEVLRKDGSRLPVEIATSVVRYEGRPAIVAFVRDITERRRAEAALVQTDRLATVGTLAAGVAHEINNPLAYVLLNLGFLERQLPDLVADESERARVTQMVMAAREGTERVATIVRDLRSVSRAEGDGRRLVDLGRVLQSALNIASNEIRRRARLVTVLQDLPAVYGNEGRLGQVFLNLLLNAAHSVPEGCQADNEIRVEAGLADGDSVAVTIRDTGTGMSPDLIQRIFDPFFTTKPPGLGTGLGLSICQSIVTAMKGTIDVQSAPGLGSSFTVTLPASGGVRLDSEPPPQLDVASGQLLEKLHILVVDDEPILADAIRDALATEHDVATAGSGEEALKRVCEDLPDVILCDLVMPGLDGHRLYDELRVRAPGMERRLVFMTGAEAIPWVAEFLAKVPNPRLLKPFDVTAMRVAVAELVDREGPAER